MVTSVNTNASALQALQNLTTTNRQLEETHDRISSGLKVRKAEDNGAIFSAARGLRMEVDGLRSVMHGLDRGISTVSIALSAGDSVSDILIQMKEKALTAAQKDLPDEQRESLNNEFTSLRDQITTIVENAGFNGRNMLEAGDPLKILTDPNADSSIEIASEDLSLSGSAIAFDSSASLGTTVAESVSALAQVESSIANVNAALSRLSAGINALETHKTFASKLSDRFETDVGNMVDADMAKESAKLQALQVKQQLGTEALSIANRTPRSILSLLQG